jgi:hypothetical protein
MQCLSNLDLLKVRMLKELAFSKACQSPPPTVLKLIGQILRRAQRPGLELSTIASSVECQVVYSTSHIAA